MSSSGPGPRLASAAANLSSRPSAVRSICRSNAFRLRMLGSSRGGPSGAGGLDAVAVGDGLAVTEGCSSALDEDVPARRSRSKASSATTTARAARAPTTRRPPRCMRPP